MPALLVLSSLSDVMAVMTRAAEALPLLFEESGSAVAAKLEAMFVNSP